MESDSDGTPGYDVRIYKEDSESSEYMQPPRKTSWLQSFATFLSYVVLFLFGVVISQYFVRVDPPRKISETESTKPTNVNFLPPETSKPHSENPSPVSESLYFTDYLHLTPPPPRPKPDVSYKSTSRRSAVCLSYRSAGQKQEAMSSLPDSRVLVLSFESIPLHDFRHGFREIENKYHSTIDIIIPQTSPDEKSLEAILSPSETIPSVVILDHPVKRLANYYDEKIRFGENADPPDRIEMWKEKSIDDWVQSIYNRGDLKNIYTKTLSRICKSWDCVLTKQDYISAVKMLNSFDAILINDWKRDPRIWSMMQNIFKLDFLQFHDNGFYKDLKSMKEKTPSGWGWMFGKITSLNPVLEKWLRKQNYWDYKLYLYAQRVLYTRIMLNADEFGIRFNFTYSEYLERPEWGSQNCAERTHPWERDTGYFKDSDAELNSPFPYGFKNDGVPMGETARDPGSKLSALQQMKSGSTGIWMLHVHKAGGTILGRMSHDLSEQFGGTYHHPETNWGSFKHKVISEQLTGEYKRHITLTSLRNPIMRLLSRYDFEERWEGGQFGIPMNRTQVWSTCSFEQQVFNHFDVRRYFNHAVKVLACRSWNCEVDQTIFNQAIKILNSIDLTFIMEWYPDPRSSFMIHDVVGWQSDDLYFRRKTFPSATHKHKDRWHWDIGKIVAVHPDMWDWLHDHNWWEMQLWDYAKRLVWKRLQTINATNFRASNPRQYAELLKDPAWGPQIPES